MKVCNVCRDSKPLNEFARRRASKDGLCMTCKACAAERCRKWRERNQGAFSKWYKENQERRAEYWQTWYQNNRERRSESYAKWARENPHTINAIVAKRNAAKKNATPKWCDLNAIKTVYRRAAALTRATGIPHSVDHIIPLQSDIVCGLHVVDNLQILPQVENLKKGNRVSIEDLRIKSFGLLGGSIR